MLYATLALAMTLGQGPAEWHEPFPGHKVIGNVYYVGSKDLATYLITTPEGHILINSGFARTVPLIQKSVESLGFKMTDVKILLASHAHSDHVAGHAALQKATGAKVFVMRGDDQVIASGGKGQYLYTTDRWDPCKVDRVLEDKEEVKLGSVTLIARLTPGHTRGCTTWTWKVDDGGKKYDVVVIGSPNVNPGFQLVGNKEYPEMAKDFAKTFEVLKSLPCDVFLGAHGAYYGMIERYALLQKGQKDAFVNPEGYREYVAQKERAFRKNLAAQEEKAKEPKETSAGRAQPESSMPDGWLARSPRDEIRPTIAFDAKSGPAGAPCFVLSTDDGIGQQGWVRKAFPVTGGKTYRFSAQRKTTNVASPRRSTPARIVWLDDNDRLVSAGAREDGLPATAEPEHPLDGPTDKDGWTSLAGDYRAPAKATKAVVELHLQWAPKATAYWSVVTFDETTPAPSRKVRLATIHHRPSGKSPMGNCEEYAPFIAEAAKQQAQLVVLGETIHYVGVSKKPHEVAEPVPGPSTDYFCALAKKHGIYLVVSLYEREGRVVYNVAVLIGPDGQIIGKYRKVCLPHAEVEWGVMPGDDYPVFDTKLGKIGMMVCYDGFFPEVARELTKRGAEVIAWPVWGCDPLLAKARANENRVFVVSSTYTDPKMNWMLSAIYDRDGTALAAADKWGAVVVKEVDLGQPHIGPYNLGDRRSMVERHRPVPIAEPAPAPQPKAPAQPAPRERQKAQEKKPVKTVAILLFDGVELMDFAGPAEVFIVADHGNSFRVVTVADRAKPLKTMGGVTVTPDFDYASAPKADIIVIPGGNMRAVGEAGRAWIKKAAKEAEITMSVCFGAMLLADAGLLDGIEATTHHWGIDQLKRAAPKCKVVEGKRFVDSGKVITTAGVTAGIDGALRVVERVLGPEAVRWTAEEWLEHPRK